MTCLRFSASLRSISDWISECLCAKKIARASEFTIKSAGLERATSTRSNWTFDDCSKAHQTPSDLRLPPWEHLELGNLGNLGLVEFRVVYVVGFALLSFGSARLGTVSLAPGWTLTRRAFLCLQLRVADSHTALPSVQSRKASPCLCFHAVGLPGPCRPPEGDRDRERR